MFFQHNRDHALWSRRVQRDDAHDQVVDRWPHEVRVLGESTDHAVHGGPEQYPRLPALSRRRMVTRVSYGGQRRRQGVEKLDAAVVRRRAHSRWNPAPEQRPVLAGVLDAPPDVRRAPLHQLRQGRHRPVRSAHQLDDFPVTELEDVVEQGAEVGEVTVDTRRRHADLTCDLAQRQRLRLLQRCQQAGRCLDELLAKNLALPAGVPRTPGGLAGHCHLPVLSPRPRTETPVPIPTVAFDIVYQQLFNEVTNTRSLNWPARPRLRSARREERGPDLDQQGLTCPRTTTTSSSAEAPSDATSHPS